LAYAWLGMYPVVFLISAIRACKAIDVRIGEYVRQLQRPLTAGIIMYAAVYALKFLAYGTPGEWLYLIQLVLVGILAYGIAMLLIDRAGLRETLQLIRP
jgi:hypothetical protein